MKTLLFVAAVIVGSTAFAEDSAFVKNVDATLPDQSVVSVVANTFQQTLYTFDMDADGQSACNGKCAEVWPPITLTPDEVAALNGHATLGVITRASGLAQLTVKGQPVYLFHLDRNVGDIKGDGVGGVWHIIK